MKINLTTKLITKLTLALVIVSSGQDLFGQVKIGDDAENVHPYAVLELESDRLGLLMPRLSDAQRDAAFVQDIPLGLTIYNTDQQCLQYWDSQQWQCSGAGDNPINTYDSMEELPATAETGTLAQVRNEDQALGLFYFNGNEWFNIYDSTAAAATATRTVISGSGAPSNTATATRIDDMAVGTLYVDYSNGALYTATDNGASDGTAGDGIPDTWIALVGQQGPQGPQGATGAKGEDGHGILIGTGSPTVSVVSPTLFIDTVTGNQYTNTDSTTWELLPGSGIASGTVNFSTLHWNGNAWVENTALTAGATNTTIDVNNNITLNADRAITLTTTNTTIDASNRVNIEADREISLTATTTIRGGTVTIDATRGGDVFVDADTNIELSATETFTLAAGNVIALTTTASIDKALLDSEGSPGQNGQLLSSTGTLTTWITVRGNTITSTITNYTASVDDGTVLVLPAAAVTITLPTPQPIDTGKILTIKRGNAYTVNGAGAPVNPLDVIPTSGTIDGTNRLRLNLSYQGYTLQAFAGNWVIIQRF